MEHIKYPSIDQFRSTVKHVRDTCNYHTIPLPTLKFRGTVKLHGTNASVVQTETEMWAQSRERIITPLSDNAGFAQYAETRPEMFKAVMARIRSLAGLGPADVVTVYGEWCGGNIQKGIGISGLAKMFVVFGIRVGTGEDTRYLAKSIQDEVFSAIGDILKEQSMYSIFDFPTWEMDINFASPELVQNQLVELTIAVENECPVAKAFGVANGVGEGIVWSCVDTDERFYSRGLLFKVKGEKHSASKVKVLAEVDVEKVNSINAFADKVVTENRLMQMKGKVVEMGLDADDVKNIGVFLKFLNTDVIKEELDTIEASGLVAKDVMSKVNRVGKDWYISNIGKEIV
jgi:hypothetical protein